MPLQVQVGVAGQVSRWLPVADLAAASRAGSRFIEMHDLGVSAWRGGSVVDAETKNAVATVAYNGRV